MDTPQLAEEISKIGLVGPKLEEVCKNRKVAEALAEIAKEANYCTKPTLLLHLALASRGAPEESKAKRHLVAKAIADERLRTSQQVDAAWAHVQSTNEPTDASLDSSAGVGVVVTEEQVHEVVSKFLADNSAMIEQERYKSLSKILLAVKKLPEMRWASPALIKPAIDSELAAMLGPKDERDDLKLQAKANKPKKKNDKQKADAVTPTSSGSMFKEGFLAHLHKAGENPQVRPELMEQHLAVTKGKVFTRFPPEPNGFLHIGHAKAIAVDFGYAAYNNGHCYLRFDDTNPEAEDASFAKSITDLVKWLGFTPYKTTWSSDYFQELYDLAEKLITAGKGYVCFCTPEEMKQHRGLGDDGSKGGARTACGSRNTTPERNLELFRQMRDGKFGKGAATLRMKQDLENPNPQMWDLVAYRVVDSHHHRTGDKWKIYPTYDFTHCLVDSMENISHSLCTLEFRLSRESYEWLCDAVDVYKPAQREFGRLNLVGSVMSKRKILQLVEKKHVRGWDDPRLYTLVGLRRRGIPPGAILSFISELGVTTSTTQIEIKKFDSSVRKYLEHSVPRLMMVLDPICVIIDNLPQDHRELISIPFKPGDDEFGSHELPFTRTIYIDRTDFRVDADSSFFRLSPGKTVGLLGLPHPIKAVSYEATPTGVVTTIHAHYETEGAVKPRSFIQWVAESPQDNSPVKIAEVREFERLFNSDNPSAHPDGYLADINVDSERIYKQALVEVGFHYVKANSPWQKKSADSAESILEGHDEKGSMESVRFQATRLGYYTLDSDAANGPLILNRIVTLKEDKNKA